MCDDQLYALVLVDVGSNDLGLGQLFIISHQNINKIIATTITRPRADILFKQTKAFNGRHLHASRKQFTSTAFNVLKYKNINESDNMSNAFIYVTSSATFSSGVHKSAEVK